VLKGGNTGPVIVPGNPDKSLLITAVRYKDKDLQMPPSDKKLPDSVIADLEQWVRMGAPDPRTEAATAKAMYAADIEKAKKHWAYRPVVKPSVPEIISSVISSSVISNQSGSSLNSDSLIADYSHPIDRFLLASMLPKGLAPSKRADNVTLIRRATFDLHGLPPTMKEVDEFLKDESANAWPGLIDRLLASPRYGE